MSREPHYLRVARALALVTGLAGIPACDSAAGTVDSGTDSSTSTDAQQLGDSQSDTSHVHDTGLPTDSGRTDTNVADAAHADTGARDATTSDTSLPLDATADAVVLGDGALHDGLNGLDVNICTTCYCPPITGGGGGGVADSGLPSCYASTETGFCCPVAGPLAPPDLAAFV